MDTWSLVAMTVGPCAVLCGATVLWARHRVRSFVAQQQQEKAEEARHEGFVRRNRARDFGRTTERRTENVDLPPARTGRIRVTGSRPQPADQPKRRM